MARQRPGTGKQRRARPHPGIGARRQAGVRSPSDAAILPDKQDSVLERAGREESEKPPVLKELEHQAVLGVLKATQWRIHGPQGAAARLGLNAFTLTSRLKRLGLARGSDAHQAFLRET